jgi:hypothetical protein
MQLPPPDNSRSPGFRKAALRCSSQLYRSTTHEPGSDFGTALGRAGAFRFDGIHQYPSKSGAQSLPAAHLCDVSLSKKNRDTTLSLADLSSTEIHRICTEGLRTTLRQCLRVCRAAADAWGSSPCSVCRPNTQDDAWIPADRC